MSHDCEQYLMEPEAHPEHAAECAECRMLDAGLAAELETGSLHIPVDGLPVAPWEGAGHRSWGLIAGAAVLLIVVVAALFGFAGIAPSAGFTRTIGGVVPHPADLLGIAGLVGSAVHEAPPAWQAGLFVAFVVVNAALYYLLRRSPRGLDA